MKDEYTRTGDSISFLPEFPRDQMFERIAEESLVGIYVVDQGRFLYVNQKMHEITGYSQDELLSEDGLRRVVHPDDWALVQNNLRKRLSGEVNAIQYTFRVIRKNGGEIFVEVYGAITNFNGRNLVIGTLVEVTDRIVTARALEQSEQQFRELTESLPQIVFEMDTTGKLTYVNPVAFRLFGYTQSEFDKGLYAHEMVVTEDREKLHLNMQQLLQGRTAKQGAEYRALRKDGTSFPALIYTTCIALQDGRQGFRGFLADITEQTAAKNALRESEQNFRGIIQRMQEGFCRATPEGSIVMMNPRFGEMIGITSWNEAIGCSLSEFIRDQEHFQNLLTQLHKEKEVTNYRHTWLTADGRAMTIKANIHLITDKMDQPKYIEGTFEDITHQIETESQLRQIQKMEAVGQLAGGIAHDFNNILTIISGYSAMLQQQLPGDSALQNAVGQIQAAGEHAAKLTRQLLAFSRKQDSAPELIDVNKHITAMSGMLKRLVSERIVIHQELMPDLPAISIDPGQFDQVILNLVINAKDAILEEGWITVQTELITITTPSGPSALSPGHYICVCIRDNGPGMSSDVKEKIFEPFFTTKAEGKGTGLGLATVYGILQQHAGTITVDSAPGEGTTMHCYFPVPKNVSQPMDKVQGGTHARAVEGSRILLLESNLDLQQSIEKQLTSIGSIVHTFDSLADALQVLDYQMAQYDIVFASPELSDAAADRIYSAIEQRNPDMAIIFLGNPYPYVTKSKNASRPFKFINKPFTFDAIVDYLYCYQKDKKRKDSLNVNPE